MLVHFDYLSEYTFSADSKVPLHDHNIYELVFYCEGTGKTNARNKTYTYRQGDCILYAPQTPHDEWHKTPSRTVCVGFSLSDQILPTVQCNQNTTAFYALKDMIHAELQKKEKNYPAMLDALTKQLCILLSRSTDTEERKDDSYCIDSAVKFIDENYRNDLNLKKLASTYAYSYDYFRHLFKAKTGIAPNQYILQHRLSFAKDLLIQTDESVQNVCFKCGFDNLSQFSFIFKKHFSLPPTAFRQLYRTSPPPSREIQ